jgi:hypothetical protein
VNDGNLSTCNGAHGGGGGSVQKMDTCPTSSSKKKKILSQKKHVTKEGGHNYGKVEGLQVQKVGMVGNLGGVGGHGAKVARWHRWGAWGLMSMCMNIHTYDMYTHAWGTYMHEHMLAWVYGIVVIYDNNSYAQVQLAGMARIELISLHVDGMLKICVQNPSLRLVASIFYS